MKEPFEHFLNEDFQPPLERKLTPVDRWIIRELLIIRRTLMATNQGLLDLQAAEVALGTSVQAAIAQLALLTQELATAVAGDDDTAVEAAAQAINAQVTALNNAVNPPTSAAKS